MKVTITVIVDIQSDYAHTTEVMRESARQAIENAVKFGADNGFDHRLADTTLIDLLSVELSE